MSPEERGLYFKSRNHIEVKWAAWELLQIFHALKYPEMHRHLSHPDYGRPLSAFIVDPTEKLHDKMPYMRQKFMPVVHAIFEDANPGEQYTLRIRLIKYYEEEVLYEADQQELLNQDGGALTVDQVLPGPDLLWSMYKTWSEERDSSSCIPLQRYIGRAIASRATDQQSAS